MKCPGQDSRYWRPGAIFDVKCPNCGEMIEFFKDDTRRRCPGCGQEVPNPEMDFGCAAYCPYAEHCLGSLSAEKAGDSKLKILKANMVKALRAVYQGNSQKMAEATSFMELCEELGKKEGADLGLVLLSGFAALCLESKHVRPREALGKLMETGADEKLAGDALALIEKGTSGHIQDEQDLKNYNVIKDASVMARFETYDRKDWNGLSGILRTDSARQIAANRAALHDS